MIAQDMLHLDHQFDGRQQSPAREESMSFQVVRHEHPNIFVVNTRTYETYRFTVGDNVMLSFPSDLSEARRTAIAFLAQRTRSYCGFAGRRAPGPRARTAPRMP
jgi:hypothetical protein